MFCLLVFVFKVGSVFLLMRLNPFILIQLCIYLCFTCTEVHGIVQETGIKTIPKKKKCRKEKWLSEEALQIAVKRSEAKSREKERYTHLNAEFQRIARRDK